MVSFEDVEGERRFRTIEGRGIPPHTDQLAVVLVGDTACTTLAKYNSHIMPTVDVNNGELVVGGVCGARITVVPKVTDVSERVEGGPVEKSVLPALEAMSVYT